MGDIIAAIGAKNGWAGCVILGAVRDSTELAKIEFGAKALGVNPAKSSKAGQGEVDVTLEFGGARFEPGHWVYCDEDGVLVAPHELEP
jgi:regulator of ribonuclease activity A